MSLPEQIGAYVDFATTLATEIEELEAKLKEKKARQRQLLEDDIPAAMDELGFQKIDADGFEVKVGHEHYASISAAKRQSVAAYAEELQLGDLVSQTIVQEFAKDEQDMFEAARALLDEHQQLYAISLNLNTGSWKAACKALAEAGTPVDWDRACIRRVRQATIKRK